MLYRTIVADPPWRVERSFGGANWANGERQRPCLDYPTMTVPEIQDMQLPADKDAHLYLWTTQGHLRDAFAVCDSWDFRYVCTLTWCKQRGGFVGGAFFSNTEFVLFARRGHLKTQKRINSQWFEWPRGKHSAKPDAFQDIVEQVSPGPYLELFARPWTPLFQARPGWHVFGNEVVSDVMLTT